jgi:hypothetical protein
MIIPISLTNKDYFATMCSKYGLVPDPESKEKAFDGTSFSLDKIVLMEETDWLDLPDEHRAYLLPTDAFFAAGLEQFDTPLKTTFSEKVEELFFYWAQRFQGSLIKTEVLFTGTQWRKLDDPSDPWQLCFRPEVGFVELRSVFDWSYPAPGIFIRK